MLNRHQRRAAQSVHKKMVKQDLSSGNWGEWESMVNEYRAMREKYGKGSANVTGFWKNNIYSAQTFTTRNGGTLMGIRRNDQSTEVPWSHKQRIKNELLGEDVTAVEVFPAKSQLVDAANMYWLWVIPDGDQYNMKLEDM